ncbi:MAG: hypothetical protein KBD19_00135 [Candidatus Moranbacteria bacterium]|nr:hypothetical protein [Candidatus Moranbacteria bacterium]
MRGKKGSGTTILYWLCQCRNCRHTFNVPRARNRPLTMEIGKAKCPDCGGFLVRSNRIPDTPARTITREQARLA